MYTQTHMQKESCITECKSGKKVAVGTVIGYSVSKGPKKATPTPAPTSNKNYKYVGSVSISSNPFDYRKMIRL